LQSLRRYTMEDSAQERITDVTRELDEAIRELRDTIYSLRADVQEEVLSSRIVRAVQEGTRASAFTPRLEISGPIDSDVPDKVAEHLLAVLREGLSNSVRHSDADHIEVSVAAIDNRIQLAIKDNGRGFANPLRRSGLANLEHRAEELHGTLDIKSAPGKGTSLVWTVPLA
jgi:signal transduction histidine kinase